MNTVQAYFLDALASGRRVSETCNFGVCDFEGRDSYWRTTTRAMIFAHEGNGHVSALIELHAYY